MQCPSDPSEYCEYISSVLLPKWNNSGKLVCCKTGTVSRNYLLELLSNYFENEEDALPHLLFVLDTEDKQLFKGFSANTFEEFSYKPSNKKRDLSKINVDFRIRLSMLVRSSAKDLLNTIDTTTELGIPQPKKKTSTCFQTFVINCKKKHPSYIILIRVGEFYQALGVDAIMLLEFTSATHVTKEYTLACVHASNIQRTLSDLIINKFVISVYEEGEVLQTPRLRYLSQIVSEASPVYNNGRTSNNDIICDALPIVCVHSQDSHSICKIYVEERRCEVFMDISEDFCKSMCDSYAYPLLCFRKRPNWGPKNSLILGGEFGADITSRAISWVVSEYSTDILKIEKSDFIVSYQKSCSRCAPLTRFSLSQFGLCTQNGTPDITYSILASGAPSVCRTQIRRWITTPPSTETSKLIKTCLYKISKSNECLPITDPPRPGYYINALTCEKGGTDILLDISKKLKYAKSILDLSFGKDIQQISENETGLKCCGESIDECIDIIDSCCYDGNILPQNSPVTNFISKHVAKLTNINFVENDFNIIDEKIQELMKFDDDKIQFDPISKTLYYPGDAVDDQQKIYERSKLVTRRHTTKVLLDTISDFLKEIDALKEKSDKIIKDTFCKLREKLHTIILISNLLCIYGTLYFHYKRTKKWCIPEVGNSIEIREGRPYWIEDGVPYDVDINEVWLLTAPNAAGKSTFLRTIGSIAILAQIGLRTPAKKAKIPYFTNIFVRAGALDCAIEKQSSFSNEQKDIAHILKCMNHSNVLCLIDEPCRGTATADGVAVLASIMEHMASVNTISVISTHFHELFDLDINFSGIKCVHIDSTSKKIGYGRCNESSCIQIAKLSGVPSPILKRASSILKRKYEDIEKNSLSNVESIARKLLSDCSESTVFKVLPGQMPPANIQSAIYIICIDDQTIYCGETSGIHSRIEQHRKDEIKKKSIFFVTECNGKTDGLQKEATIISQKIPWLNVTCISDKDGYHTQVFM